MICRFTPQSHTPEELLLKIGFESVSRGYALKRKGNKSKRKPVQIHAIPYFGDIDLHADLQVEGKHVTNKSIGRMTRWIEILDAVDRGVEPNLSESMRKKYKFKI